MKDRVFEALTGETVEVRYCFDCDTSFNGEGFLEAYIKDGYDEELNPWTYIGELDCNESATDNEILEAIDKLLHNH